MLYETLSEIFVLLFAMTYLVFFIVLLTWTARPWLRLPVRRHVVLACFIHEQIARHKFEAFRAT